MTTNETAESTDHDMEALYAELATREAKVVQRENALQEREAALLGEASPSATPSGLKETDLDLSTAPAEAQQGREAKADQQQRKAYAQWLRETHPGQAPLKSFHVTLKKKNTDDRSFRVDAVDEADARRLAYQQAGIAQRTEGYNAIVQRV